MLIGIAYRTSGVDTAHVALECQSEARQTGLFGRLAAQQRCLLTVRHIANYRRVKSTFEAIFEQHLPDIIGLGEVRSA